MWKKVEKINTTEPSSIPEIGLWVTDFYSVLFGPFWLFCGPHSKERLRKIIYFYWSLAQCSDGNMTLSAKIKWDEDAQRPTAAVRRPEGDLDKRRPRRRMTAWEVRINARWPSRYDVYTERWREGELEVMKCPKFGGEQTIKFAGERAKNPKTLQTSYMNWIRVFGTEREGMMWKWDGTAPRCKTSIVDSIHSAKFHR